MPDSAHEFCDSVHEKLEALQGRMDSLKLNIGTTWHSLGEKLDEVRLKHGAAKPALAEARATLEKWVAEKNAEVKNSIDQWVENRETQKLAARAQHAEECAWLAIMIAQASIDDAERAILEAIAAKLDSDAAKRN